MTIAGRLISVIPVVAVMLLGGCTKKEAPKMQLLSEQEAADLWNKAESRQAIGDPMIRKFQTDNGTVVSTTQAYALRMAGGGGGSLVTVCGGSCIVEGNGSLHECQTSGCMPSGNTCTPLVCSGSCKLSNSCRAEATIGVVGAVAF